MTALLVMLKNVLIFVLLAVPGYLLVKGKVLRSADSAPLSKLLTEVGVPFMVFSSTLKLEFTPELTRTLLITAGLTMIYLLLLFPASALTARRDDPKRRGMERFCMIFANNGFIGIPLARAVFGEGSAVVAYVIVINILNNVVMFSLGAPLVAGDRSARNLKKAVFNPVILAFVLGIALNLVGINGIVPEVQTYCTHFSNIVTPISMVILGMKLAGVPMANIFATRRLYWVSALRLVVFPVLGTAAVLSLHWLGWLWVSADAVLAFFVAAAMPCAGLASAIADQCGGDTENAVKFTLGATILSVATIPVLYWALCLLV